MSEGAAKKEGFDEKPQPKEKPRKFQAIRGTRDLLPPETALWNRVEQTAHEVFATYGYGEIRLPLFEETELFARGVGEDTDIVGKEMYTFEDRPGELPDFGRESFDIVKAAQDITKLFERGQIPQSSLNTTLLRFLQIDLDRFSAVHKRLQSNEDRPGDTDEYRKTAISIVHRLRDIELGPRVSLRPEATASICRAYIEHNMQQLPQPVKLYCIGPMFRRERPQKGRYRQFYQIDAEVLEKEVASGEWRVASKELAKDAAIDAEVIEMLMTFFDRIGLQGTEMSINSIGHAADNCRRGYVAKLREELTKARDKLGEDSKRRIDTNPLRVLDSKLGHEQVVIEKLPRIADHLCDDCKTHYAAVKRELDLRGVKYQENWRLVRGLDYYMRTTFEITAKGLGSQNAVCGGGRYDGLVELLGGPPTKGIGFAIGEDRLILSLQEARKEVASGEQRDRKDVATIGAGRDVYIAWMGEKAYTTAIGAAKKLRAAGFGVELPPVEQKFGKALGQADKLGAKFALILGDNEVSSGQWTLKTLADGSQQKLTEAALLEYLRKL